MRALASSRLGQVHISVTDVDRAVEFYRDRLGLTFLFRVPGQPMAFFDCGGTRLYLAEAEPGFHSQPVLYFAVASIDEAYAELQEAGVPFQDAPHRVHADDAHELWLAFFSDPDGCVLALMEERRV